MHGLQEGESALFWLGSGRQRSKGKSLRADRLKTKKSRNRNDLRSRLYLFCIKFYATISRPLTPRADRATIAQTKKAKIRGVGMDSIKRIVTNT